LRKRAALIRSGKVFWNALKKVCGMNGCKISLKLGNDKIDLTAASAVDALKLLRQAERMRAGEKSKKTNTIEP
jgi:hypothetical protein